MCPVRDVTYVSGRSFPSSFCWPFSLGWPFLLADVLVPFSQFFGPMAELIIYICKRLPRGPTLLLTRGRQCMGTVHVRRLHRRRHGSASYPCRSHYLAGN